MNPVRTLVGLGIAVIAAAAADPIARAVKRKMNRDREDAMYDLTERELAEIILHKRKRLELENEIASVREGVVSMILKKPNLRGEKG